MSKLVDKLKSLNRDAAPIGFRPAGPSGRQPPLLVIGRVPMPTGSSSSFAGAVNGLDAAIIPGKGITAEALERLGRAAPGLPLGLAAGELDPAKLAGLAEAGADFVVFRLNTAAAVLETEKLGRFLELAGEAEPSRVMTAGELAPVIDGIVISGAGTAITLEYLLACRRALRLFGLPVLVEVPSSVTGVEIKCLWEAGVAGVVTADTGATAGIRKAVESLPKERRQWGSRPRPILPKLGENTVSAEEDEG